MNPNARLSRITTRTATRRSVLAGSLAAIGAAATGSRALAQTPGATPVASPVAGGTSAPFLMVTDREEPTLWFYSIPDGRLTGRLDNLFMASHGSAFQLPNGRLILGRLGDQEVDLGGQSIDALVLDDQGVPSIVASVPATFGESAAWIVVDPGLTTLVFGSLREGDDVTQILNVVDLASFTNTELEFEMNEPEEITAWLLGDPLHLYVSVGGRIDSYDLAALLGGNTTPLGSVDVDLGSHGGATDAARDQLFYVTEPGTGMEVLDVSSGVAEYVTQIPWDIDGRTGGYNARANVSGDGYHIFGVLTGNTEDPTRWAEFVCDLHVINMADLTATRTPIGTGAFTTRWAMGGKVALAAGYNADGGTAYAIDTDVESETFATVVQEIPVNVPTNGQVAGEWDDEAQIYYVCAITPDDMYGFVTIPGDGLVQVLDLAAGEVIGEIATETDLSGFGYSKVIQGGITPVDLWGR
ncbi:MAG TPA: hypothetical protein VGT61_11915 [Thermomicrobiales bacterium]|jgi:hypothetical protein|nr:hypothetical protein [Thermomicrobiales bacterium]